MLLCDSRAVPQNHKPYCQNNTTLTGMLKEYESTPRGLLDRLLLPDGVSLYELDQRLEKWVQFHTTSLMAACLHAIRLPEDINNIRTHVMYVRLQAREDHGNSAGKYFRVVDAYPVAVAEGMRRPSPWPESLLQLRALQDESERMGRGRTGATMIECTPLAVQTVPFGSVVGFDTKFVLPDWKETLTRDIEQGKRFIYCCGEHYVPMHDCPNAKRKARRHK